MFTHCLQIFYKENIWSIDRTRARTLLSLQRRIKFSCSCILHYFSIGVWLSLPSHLFRSTLAGWPYNWNSVRGNYLPPFQLPAHAPSPRDCASAWLTNLPVHSLPSYFTWYTGFLVILGRGCATRAYPSVVHIILGSTHIHASQKRKNHLERQRHSL